MLNEIQIAGKKIALSSEDLGKGILNLEMQNIQSIKEIEDILSYIENKQHITALNLSGNKISIDGIELLATKCKVQELNLSGSNLSHKKHGTKAIQAIKSLAMNTHLRKLDLTSCDIHDESAKELSTMKELQSLILADNSITKKGAKVVANMPALIKLNINKNMLTENEKKNIAQKILDRVNRVNGFNKFKFKIRADLTERLSKSTNTFNQLPEEILQEIVDCVLSQIQIAGKKIVLSSEDLDKGILNLEMQNIRSIKEIEDILSYIENKQHITTLNLSGNKISIDGIELLATKCKVQELNLSGSNLSHKKHGTKAIQAIKSLAMNTHLRKLDLTGCSIFDESAKELSTMRELQSLILANNSITKKGAKIVANMPALIKLNINKNMLTENEEKNIAQKILDRVNSLQEVKRDRDKCILINKAKQEEQLAKADHSPNDGAKALALPVPILHTGI